MRRHTFTALYVHVVFATHARRPLITLALQTRLHEELAEIAKNLDVVPIAINGIDDHVHLLLRIGPEQAVANVVRDLKRLASRWMHDQGCAQFAWQRGYSAFTVSESRIGLVKRYVDRQREHHQRTPTSEEMSRLFR